MDTEDHDEIEHRPVEINDLNKTQLILLAILLSFVVSIATGIVTVTLMQRASPVVNQTINRVVQHTIEKVVPDYTPDKTQTVVVKEDDMVVDAITKTRANDFTLFADKELKQPLLPTYSLGQGSFLVTSATLSKDATYFIKSGNAVFELHLTKSSPLGFGILTEKTPALEDKNLPKASFAKDADIKVGQTAVIIGENSVRKGLVQEVKKSTSESVPTYNTIVLDTDVSSSMIGALVSNLDGDSIGLVVPKGDDGAMIIGIDAVGLTQ